MSGVDNRFENLPIYLKFTPLEMSHVGSDLWRIGRGALAKVTTGALVNAVGGLFAQCKYIIKTHVRGFFDTDLHEVSWHFATHEAAQNLHPNTSPPTHPNPPNPPTHPTTPNPNIHPTHLRDCSLQTLAPF